MTKMNFMLKSLYSYIFGERAQGEKPNSSVTTTEPPVKISFQEWANIHCVSMLYDRESRYIC
jgi:hypothetical protein